VITLEKVEVKKGTCPHCGADRAILADCLSSPVDEDRSTAWIIVENCVECKAAMQGALNG
jgi:Fe-S-cluster-containing hydrogenase component 2